MLFQIQIFKKHIEARIQEIKISIPALKDLLFSIKTRLELEFFKGISIRELINGRAILIDTVIKFLWKQIVNNECTLALIAVGGYGRMELYPNSDIDLLILIEEDKVTSKVLEKDISAFIMILWDIGLHIGQSVRTVNESIFYASKDITIITNLIEARLLLGQVTLFKDMKNGIAKDKVWPIDQFFNAKIEERHQYYLRYDNVTYNLEPNIKEGPGGLRDIQMISWIAKRYLGIGHIKDLVPDGFLTKNEFYVLYEGQEFLRRIRFALHTLANREENRLLFNYQQRLVRQFSYKNSPSNLTVEEFMRYYYRTVTEIKRLNKILLQHFFINQNF